MPAFIVRLWQEHLTHKDLSLVREKGLNTLKKKMKLLRFAKNICGA